MKVLLDHMSVPVHSKAETARFYASVFGVATDGPRARSGWLTLSDALSLIFEEGDVPDRQHYAFRVDPGDFEILLERVRRLDIPFGSSADDKDGRVKSRPDGSRSYYFSDPNGHGVEVITQG
jgi:catechol 2,3-dioxygenase-like lactoylglutathione lyase family enzyme